MSRIGRLPITVPSGATLEVADRVVTAKGPKGELSLTLHPHTHVAVDGPTARVTVDAPDLKQDRALWGLTRVLVNNLVIGVTQGYEKKLEINGIGYRAEVRGQEVHLSLGFSHPVVFPLPAGIAATVEKNVVSIRGIDKQQVGETAAKIRRLRKPEPYKGKGIKYSDEIVRRKAGKVVKAAGAK